MPHWATSDVITAVKLNTPLMDGYSERKTAPTISAGALTIDCATCATFVVALNANITTLTLSNPAASGSLTSILLAFVADGTVRTITWPASVKWPSAIAPTMTGTNGRVDLLQLMTWDGGTTWYAVVGGQNFA